MENNSNFKLITDEEEIVPVASVISGEGQNRKRAFFAWNECKYIVYLIKIYQTDF